MTNIPKPELEQGCYIAYTDEPNTVVSGSGGGGGGDIVIIEGIPSDANIEMQASYNDLNEHFNNGKVCFLRLANVSGCAIMLISFTKHSTDYSAGVVFTTFGETPTIAEFKADSATENLVLTNGG